MILNQIVADSKLELEAKKKRVPVQELKRMALEKPPAVDFKSALRGDRLRIIAEVKKASPSRGIIRQEFYPAEIAKIYADNGAAAISVLTETKYFQGSLEHMKEIRNTLGSRVPLLRKGFIHDHYQIYESRAYSADAILLITAILTREKQKDLLELSHSLGMSCLVEVHNEAELNVALESGARIIGINNRDLNTFKVDIETTRRLRPLITQDRIVVSESGIKDRADMQKLRDWRVDAVLVGEAFMASPDIAAKMRELL